VSCKVQYGKLNAVINKFYWKRRRVKRSNARRAKYFPVKPLRAVVSHNGKCSSCRPAAASNGVDDVVRARGALSRNNGRNFGGRWGDLPVGTFFGPQLDWTRRMPSAPSTMTRGGHRCSGRRLRHMTWGPPVGVFFLTAWSRVTHEPMRCFIPPSTW
jgi:hypothetical protein